MIVYINNLPSTYTQPPCLNLPQSFPETYAQGCVPGECDMSTLPWLEISPSPIASLASCHIINSLPFLFPIYLLHYADIIYMYIAVIQIESINKKIGFPCMPSQGLQNLCQTFCQRFARAWDKGLCKVAVSSANVWAVPVENESE